MWSQAGAVTRTELAGIWWAATPAEYWPQDTDSMQHIRSRMQAPYGDRQQELVIIGMQMDKAALTAKFDACLLTESELAQGMEAWRKLPDPFPHWSVNLQDDDEAVLEEVV